MRRGVTAAARACARAGHVAQGHAESRERPPGLCLVILGGGGQIGPPGFWLTHPPTHPHQKIFPQEKNEIYQRGPNLEVDFRYTNFFLASDPPPPPGIVSTSH